MARRLLAAALGSGGDHADLFFEYAVQGEYVHEEGMLKSASRSVSMGLGVRVMKGEATGYAYVEDFDFDAMKNAAACAGRIAAQGGSKKPLPFHPVSAPTRYPVARLSFDVAGEAKKELLGRADKAARSADPRIRKVSASLFEELRELQMFTSAGRQVRDRQPLVRFAIDVIAEENGKRQSGRSGGGGRRGLEYFELRSPEEHAAEAVRQALVMLDAREAPAGEMEVVLAPGYSGILVHEAVGHGLEADFNRKGTSNYTGRVGQSVASPLCTVVDDATLRHGRGSINIDDEGHVPTSATLIHNGVLQGYLHDRQSAAFFGVEPTGNGRRESFRKPPMPRMTNTLLLPGEDAPEDIVRSVKKGIYAKKFRGGEVDISNGDFVFGVTEGYLIEDGKLTAPITGVNLMGNGPEAMRNIAMLGHDLEVSDGTGSCGKEDQSVPVGVGCPTIKVNVLTVGGTALR